MSIINEKQCSRCGRIYDYRDSPNVCPYCGKSWKTYWESIPEKILGGK